MWQNRSPADLAVDNVLIYTSLLILTTLIQAPLDVIEVRLAIQRNHAAIEPAVGPAASNGAVEDSAPPTFEEQESVVRSRDETAGPYRGLADCVEKIIKEEGGGTLYRAWAFTFLGGLATAA